MPIPFASIADFASAFPDLEVLDLSDLDDSDRFVIRTDKLQRSLTDASYEICAILGIKADGSIAHPVFRQWVCDIARYRLDSYDPREDVRQRYEDVIELVKEMRKAGGVPTIGTETEDELADRSGSADCGLGDGSAWGNEYENAIDSLRWQKISEI